MKTVAELEPSFSDEWVPDTGVDADLLGLTGCWYWGATALLLRVLPGGVLDLSAVKQGRGSRFRPNGDGTWTGMEGYYAGEVLRVVRDAQGGVRHLDVGTFVLTRGPYEPEGSVPGGVDPGGWG